MPGLDNMPNQEDTRGTLKALSKAQSIGKAPDVLDALGRPRPVDIQRRNTQMSTAQHDMARVAGDIELPNEQSNQKALKGLKDAKPKEKS
jgi:hypothetical protein